MYVLNPDLPSWPFYIMAAIVITVLFLIASALMYFIHNLLKVNTDDFKGSMTLTAIVVVSAFVLVNILSVYVPNTGLPTYESAWAPVFIISLILSYLPYAIIGKIYYQISWLRSLEIYVIFITVPILIYFLPMIYY